MTFPLTQFQSLLGQAHVLTGAAMQDYLTDTRRLITGQACAVLRPETTEQVGEIVKICAAHKIAITPQGGNTSYMGGAIPQQTNTVILQLGRMNKIRNLNPQDFTITVDAGCILQNIQEAAAAKNCLFPLKLASEGTCQIGGNIATNAGGILTLRYGNTRDLVLGLEVVLADGRIWNGLRHLRKDNTGYDLKQLFIGSEGSLGIITGAVLKLFPAPQARETFLLALKDLNAAPDLYTATRAALGDCLSAFELIPQCGLDLARRYNIPHVNPLAGAPEWMILGEVTTGIKDQNLRGRVDTFLQSALESGAITDGTLAESEQQRSDLWRTREAIVEAQRYSGVVLKHDISVAIASIPAFIAEAGARLTQAMPGILPYCFGHLGDGNLHFNFIQPPEMPADTFRARMKELEKMVHNLLVDKYNGSFSAEHGIGQFKRDELASRKSPVEMEMMRTIKRALDPHNVMNPGCVV